MLPTTSAVSVPTPRLTRRRDMARPSVVLPGGAAPAGSARFRGASREHVSHPRDIPLLDSEYRIRILVWYARGGGLASGRDGAREAGGGNGRSAASSDPSSKPSERPFDTDEKRRARRIEPSTGGNMSKSVHPAAGIGPCRKSRLPIAIALAIAGAEGTVHAQTEDAAVEEVVVTGSRLRPTGMDTPNPVTIVTPEEINLLSPTTMVEGLAQLPQFFMSNTTANTGGFFTSPGAGTLNLRGLQGKRTLSLLDGRRIVSSTIFGGPDINLFPEQLIRTVETVTGGATAAYGTDA